MKKTVLLLSLALVCNMAMSTERSSSVAYQFRKLNACPATGKIQRTCPGYVIDHMIPLCAGGPDTVENMVFQAKAASYRKDALERALCRRLVQCLMDK
jgi:hypothetical protein